MSMDNNDSISDLLLIVCGLNSIVTERWMNGMLASSLLQSFLPAVQSHDVLCSCISWTVRIVSWAQVLLFL